MPVIKSKKEPRPGDKEPRVDELLMKPGDYEVTPDTTFSIDIYLKRVSNRWVLQSGPGKEVVKEIYVPGKILNLVVRG